MHAETVSPKALERLARRRAGAKLGWSIHATVYVLVNALLALLAASHGESRAVVPLLGWGLGLLIHAAVVFLFVPGGRFHAWLLARERRALGGGDGR